MAGDDIRSRGDRRRGGDVERLGAAGAQRDRHLGLALRRAPRPAAPRARRRGRASRRRPAPSSPSPPWATRATRGAGVSSTSARAGGWAKIEPMLARTAFGEKGSAQPGPSDDRAVEQGVGGADDRADVAGVADPVQVDAGRAGRLGPAQRPDRDRPRARAERRDRRPAAPARPPRRRGRCRRRLSRKRGSAPAASPASTRSSPSVANRPSRSRCLRSRSLRTSFSFSFWGLAIIWSVRVRLSLLVGGFFSWNEKAGRDHGPPGKVECRCAARRPHPPGLAPQIGGRHRGR